MSYCLNPLCQHPENEAKAESCQACGTRIRLKDRYRPLRLLGSGGFGRTFLAVDEDKPSNPRCVIKQFYPRDQLPDTRAKASQLFQQEAVRLDELGQHPNIPDLLAYIEQDQHAYVVQSFIDGPTLADVLQSEGSFAAAAIQDVLQQVLPILEFVHQHHVIHRDIKPANIIRRRQDQHLVLVDFGAARHATGTTLDRTGTMIGSAEFTAPEQVRGRAVFASDLYSLGVTCIHLMTQMRPFDLFDVGEDCWVWTDYLQDPISPKLQAILDKLLQRALNRRYATATEVLQELNSLLASTPPLVQPSAPLPPVLWTLPPPPSPAPSLQSDGRLDYRKLMLFLDTRTRGSVWSVAFSPDNRWLAYSVGTRFAFPIRDNAIRIWDLSVNQEKGILDGHENHVLSLVFHPDGDTLISAGRDETIRLWSFTSEQERQVLLGHIDWINQVALSPDGSVLASCSEDCTIRLWTLTSPREHSLEGPREQVFRCIHPVQGIVFSPTDPYLISSGVGHTDLWNWQTKQKVGRLPHPMYTSRTLVALTADGSRLAIADPEQVDIWEQFTSDQPQLIMRLPMRGSTVSAITFSPDGTTVVVGTESGEIQLWLIERQVRLRLVRQEGRVTSLAFSPDGRLLASGSIKATLQIWAVAE